LFITGRQENQQAFQLWFSNPLVSLAIGRAPSPRKVASGRGRSGPDGRAGQVGGIGAISKHIGIRGLEELDIVLHAAVGAL
jgi:hypothetical protein